MDFSRRIYDISVPLDGRTTVYPGDPAMTRETILTLAAGDTCELSQLTLSSHAGTHLDAPAHFIAGGKTIDQCHLESFIRPARVVCVPDRAAIQAVDLISVNIRSGEALLLKTDNSLHRRCFGGAFDPDYVYLTSEAAGWCVERRLALVGIDALSVDAHRDEGFAAHRRLLEAGVLILESIDLKAVPEGRFTLLCLPLKIVSGEASPVRAVLLA